MKTFDDLYAELSRKIAHQDVDSGTVKLLDQGVHAIGKKVVEEAAEVLMLVSKVSLDDVYRRL